MGALDGAGEALEPIIARIVNLCDAFKVEGLNRISHTMGRMAERPDRVVDGDR